MGVEDKTQFPGSSQVDEFFLKMGAPRFPYLMLSQIRGGESPGLDHLSVLVGDLVAARSTLARNGISLVEPHEGLWFRDKDDTLIELMASPTWSLPAQSMRLPAPSNLRDFRPAFEAAALTRIYLRALDVDRSASFYSQLFGREKVAGGSSFTYGATVLELRPVSAAQTPASTGWLSLSATSDRTWRAAFSSNAGFSRLDRGKRCCSAISMVTNWS
jgi:hypothetical protein